MENCSQPTNLNFYIYDMRKIEILILCLALVMAISCSDSTEPQTADKSSKKKPESPLGRDLTGAEKKGMRLMKRRQEARERGVTDKSQNKTSAYRYLISSDEYPIFAKLVKKSSLSKHIHSGDVTLLAPIDRAFEAYPEYKTLLKPGNESALDEFVSYHIVDEPLEYKAFSDGTDWTVHSGTNLQLTKEGGIYFGDAHVRSGSIETDKGTIIGMDDIIYFPSLSRVTK